MAGVTPLQIWDALLAAGASMVQAAGIMGNMIAESSLNPEASSVDSNGYRSNGLAQWNEASYPGSASLVTGNPAADMQAQINFLTTTGGLQAASGTTVAETAGNFAATYERCQGCQPGGSQYDQRVANAEQVAGWAASGDWPSTASQGSASAVLTSAQLTAATQAAQDCLWGIGWGQGQGASAWEWLLSPLAAIGSEVSSGEVCVISKPQARAVLGVLLVAGGVTVTALGVVLLLAAAGLSGPRLLTMAAGPAAAVANLAGAPEEVPRPARQARPSAAAVSRSGGAVTGHRLVAHRPRKVAPLLAIGWRTAPGRFYVRVRVRW